VKRVRSVFIITFVVLGGSLVGFHIWAQHTHVPLFVGVDKPIAAEVQRTLDNFNKTNPIVFSNTYKDSIPYDSAIDKVLPLSEISIIRRNAAWSSLIPYSLRSIVIYDESNVVAYVKTRDSSAKEITLHFRRQDGRWAYEVHSGMLYKVK